MTPGTWAALKWGGIALAVALLFFWVRGLGYDAGQAAGVALGDRDRAQLSARLATAQSDAAACGATLGRVNQETARAIREADARAAAGASAAAQAAAAARDAQEETARASGALTAAKRLPTCRAQLEMPLCDDIPLL